MSLGFDNLATSFESWQLEVARTTWSGSTLPISKKTKLLVLEEEKRSSSPILQVGWRQKRLSWEVGKWVHAVPGSWRRPWPQQGSQRGQEYDHTQAWKHQNTPVSSDKVWGFLISSYWSFPDFVSLQAGLKWESLWGRGNPNHRCHIFLQIPLTFLNFWHLFTSYITFTLL